MNKSTKLNIFLSWKGWAGVGVIVAVIFGLLGIPFGYQVPNKGELPQCIEAKKKPVLSRKCKGIPGLRLEFTNTCDDSISFYACFEKESGDPYENVNYEGCKLISLASLGNTDYHEVCPATDHRYYESL